ncbi:putative Zn-binding protein involved in type VI secretion [Luteimonas cucumeris]|uniref:Putative Zn-binding protein involved in type VI secretion n=1 Tax=Luteimonas cucumeris TaxID=985012 RepID=A0A562L738_9GAMM|nr:PAAR domain-containing protein [Luteimonas cucumeris]TWI03448.1 putative Zn-binding protein involved in type VI secretion [Luteimonas cucumeris]
MARNWIVVGDATSSGGRVITGSPVADIDGMPVSRVSDRATCPRHKGVFPIVDGDITLVVDGQPVALHGSSLACGCRVLTAQQSHVYVDAGGSSRASNRSASAEAATAVASVAAFTGKYDEAFILVSELTGKPLAHRGYRVVRPNGSDEMGTTDSDGKTHLVNTDESENLKVELEEEVPA